MELALLAGVGLFGYYLNINDNSKKVEPTAKILVNEIPNGFDIYNDNHLSVAEEKERNLAKISYHKSQYPQKTNIIPNYYNQLGPLLNMTKFNDKIKYDKVETLYNINDDLDDIYSDLTSNNEVPADANKIFKSTMFDRDKMYLNDEYEEFHYKHKLKPVQIPGLERKNIDPVFTKSPTNRVEAFRNLDTNKKKIPHSTKLHGETKLSVLDKFQNSQDNNLLDVSENITDNADSIRRILREDVTGQTGTCKRKQTPYDDTKAKRLIGVTPDMHTILVDDDTAKFPTFREKQDEPMIATNYPSYLAQFELQTFDSNGLPSAPNDIYQTSDKVKLSDLERQLAYKGGWTQYDQNGSMVYGVVSENQLTHDNMVPFFNQKYGYGSNDLQNEFTMNFKNELFTGNLKTTWNKKQEIRPFFTPVADLSYIYGSPVRSEEEESRYIPSLYRQNEKLFDEIRVTPGLNLGYNEIGTQGYVDMYRSLPKTVDELRIRTKPKITYEGRIIDGLKGNERPVQAPVVSYRPDGFKITTEEDYLPTNDVNSGPRSRENFIMKETDRSEQNMEYTGGAFNKEEAIDQTKPEYMREKYKYSDRQNFTLPKPLQKFAKDESKFNPNIKSYDLPFTTRSQTSENDYVGIANTHSRAYTDISDEAKITIKELNPVEPYKYTYMKPNTMRGTTIMMDDAKTTVREITSENQLNPNAISLNTQQKVYYSDVPKVTIRETVCDPIEPSNINKQNNVYANWTDNPRMTLKETTVEMPVNTQILAIGQGQGSVHPQDIAKTTIRENSVQIPYQTFVNPINQSQGTMSYQDNAKTTLREGTSQISYETFISPIDQSQGPTPYQDITRTTIKEGTVQIPHKTFIKPINQSQGKIHPQDIMKTTLKEKTSQNPNQTFIKSINQSQGSTRYQDIAKTTIREDTSQIPYNTFMKPINQSNVIPYQDVAKTTIREGTVNIPNQTNIKSINKSPGSTQYQDIAKTTIREGTIQIPYNVNVTAINQSQGQGNSFNWKSLRPTIKENTIQIPYQTNVTAVDQSRITAQYQDVAKATIKEITEENQYNSNTNGITFKQGQASTFDRKPLRNTIKETTIQNDIISGPTSDTYSKGYGYIAESMFAPNTNKQFTSQEVYIQPAQGDIMNRLYNDAYNAVMDDRKDILHWYHPPTASGVNLGPIKEQLNVVLKNDDNKMSDPFVGYSVNNNLDRLKTEGSVNSPKLDVPNSMYVDPKILMQLNANPYNIPYFGTNYN
uniref:Uncharacterized protein n=1 Tax=viral metagenome TaxID=1070528 RepID=A0A6C0LR06_9ZZZZ